jgi:hypothetical protein
MKIAFLFLLILFAGCTVNINIEDPDGTSNNDLNNSGNNAIINQNNSGQNIIDNNGTISQNDSSQDINENLSDNDATIIQNNTGQNASLIYETFYDEGVSVQLPQNWAVEFYGSCATKSFIAYDINNPVRQVFYFSEAGPVYTSQLQKDNDLEWKAYYESIGSSYLILYTQSPVVSPLNAQNFLTSFKSLAETDFMETIAPLSPKMYEFQIISSADSAQKILPNANDAKTIRALFKQDGALGEGLFYVETFDYGAATGGFMNIGYGMTFIGLTAKDDEFPQYEAVLNSILNSYTISQEYVSKCIQAQNAAGAAAVEIGQTLSETSDIMMDAWDNRQRSDDILSEKWSDTTLSYERVYDPETGEVYRVENGFYDSYNINREHFEMNNLEQLPDNDWDLWTAVTNYEEDIR